MPLWSTTRVTADELTIALPGDQLVPDAGFVLDRAATLPGSAERLWPWLVQCGKGRGGWYAPRLVERFVPNGRRGLRRVELSFQHLSVGDVEPDWGPGDPTFVVEIIRPPSDLVYSSRRGHMLISWALHVSQADAHHCRLHSRFRMGRDDGKRGSSLLRSLGDALDWVTISLLFAGLRERLDT